MSDPEGAAKWLQPIPENIPAELKERNQWVLWRVVLRDGKETKVPFNPHNLKPASCSDPATWGSFQKTWASFQKSKFDGIGYELSADDPFCGWDLDHCLDLKARKIKSWAADIVKRLNSYTEISPSGTGLRIIVKASLPPNNRRKGGIEIYTEGRFLTMTGHSYDFPKN